MSHTPAAPSNEQPTPKGHPPGLFLLFAVEMWERFSYYGMRGLLVLYLTAALAAHQLGNNATYTNTLRIEQTEVLSEEQVKAKVEPRKWTTLVPMSVTVGSGEASEAGVRGDAGPLKIERLIRDTSEQDKRKAWKVAGEGFEPAKFYVQQGTRPAGDAVHYKVSNPTDAKVKLSVKILRPYSEEEIKSRAYAARANAKPGDKVDGIEEALRSADDPNYKVYFTVNNSTSIVSTNIQPDAKREALGDEPFDLAIDINRIDSGRSWLKGDAGNLYGWYTGMAYLLPILGGLIADKLIGTHRSMIVGSLLIIAGHVSLGVSGFGDLAMNAEGMAVFMFGLALITIGTGHFKPSVSVMVGQLYPRGDPRRESAFSIFYMGINLGAFLCNIVCGYLAFEYGWHYGFAAAAVGMVLGLVCYLVGKPVYLKGIGESDSPHRNKAAMFLPIGVLLAGVVGYLSYIGVLSQVDEFFSNRVVYVSLIVAAAAYGLYFIAKQAKGDKGPVATIFIYMLFNAVFWLSFEQAGSSLTVFTEELTDRRLPGGLGKLDTPQFQSLNPLLIILFAPIAGMVWANLARRGKAFGQPFKIGLGLIFVGLGYIVMVLAAERLNSGVAKVGMVYICGCYFLHTVGEIILSPTGLSYVSKTAPAKHVSTLMGMWFISSFIAGLMAGKVSALVDPIIEGKVKMPWNLGGQADFFMFFVVSSITAGLLVMALGAGLIRLQRDPKD